MKRINLNVPYNQKDEAKSHGARWDAKNKTWFITTNLDINLFRRWLPNEADSEVANSLAPIFFITSYCDCWKCKKESPVYCIASSGYIYKGKKHHKFTVYSNLKASSNDIEKVLKEAYPKYRLDYSKTTSEKYFLNHCEFCDAKMGDFFLHNEHDCAFSPMSISSAERATLTKLPSDKGEFMILGDFYRPYPFYIEKYAKRY